MRSLAVVLMTCSAIYAVGCVGGRKASLVEQSDAIVADASTGDAAAGDATTGETTSDAAAADASLPDASRSDASQTCIPPVDCLGINSPVISIASCCTPATACGYEVEDLDEETLMYFPDADELVAQLTAGDPDGRCASDSYFFGLRDGLYKHRVEVDSGDDILITPDCDSYTLMAFILPGCCLPDDTCGFSTDESWPTLGYLAGDLTAPFAQPECVSAAEINRQFAATDTVNAFARVEDSGKTCDRAALAAELPAATP